MTITSFDINLDGVPELITGWSDGKVDAKSDRNGEVVFKCNLDHSIAGVLHVKYFNIKILYYKYHNLFKCDYKMDGNEELLCCSVEGEIKGFKATSSETMAMVSDTNLNQDTIRDMTQRKQVQFL
jgi:Bardet-Biedl syndrome 2 protein